MFDYKKPSIEEARREGETILDWIEGDLPPHLEAIFAKGIVNVVRVVQKDPGVGRPKTVLTVGTMPADELFSLMEQKGRRRQGKNRQPTFDFDGVTYTASLRSPRLWCFKKNPNCVVCGAEGVEFRLERNWTHEPGTAHWNLYGRNDNGHWVLMTVDHRIPLSKGGPDHPDNFQTMCERCNLAKKDDCLTVEEVRARLRIGHPPHGVPQGQLSVGTGLDDDRPVKHGMDVAKEGDAQ